MADDEKPMTKKRREMLKRLEDLRRKYKIGEFAPKRDTRRATGDFMTDKEEKLVERGRRMGIPNAGIPQTLPYGSPKIRPEKPNANPYDVP